jgi:hypothetical protein
MAAGASMSAGAGWQDYTPQSNQGWQDYREPSVESPIAPPSNAAPYSVQPESSADFVNRVTGHPEYKVQPITPKSIAQGVAHDARVMVVGGYQAMAKGMAGGKPILGQPPTADEFIKSGANVATGMILGAPETEGIPPTPGLNQVVNSATDAVRVPVSDPTLSGLRNMLSRVRATAQPAAPSVPATAPPMGVATPEMQQGWSLAQVKQPLTQPASVTGEALGTIKPAQAIEQGQPVSVGQLPLAKGNPYAGPRTPLMDSVQSGNHELAGYDAPSQTMVVQFKNGGVYEYRGVPQEIYDQYSQSESQGSFFSRNIKGRYTTNFRGTVKPARK